MGLAQWPAKGKRRGSGFRYGNRLLRGRGSNNHNVGGPVMYGWGMDPMMIIPKDRKALRPLKLVLLLGVTVLLFILILIRYGEVAQAVLAAKV